MPRIFISYRRDDSGGHTGRLADRLRERFGTDSVFMDVADIAVGADFKKALKEAVQSADAVLVVIGKTWLALPNPTSGRRRIEDPDDWVRLEIIEALQRDVPVVPVYVQGASLLDESSLPGPLKPLAARQAAVLHDGQWRSSVEDLVSRLSSLFGSEAQEPPARLRKPLVVAIATLAVAAAAWIAAPRFWQGENAPGSASQAPPAPQNPDGDLFTTHGVIGGYWYESAFNAYVQFNKGGTIGGRYYQYTLTGRWGPLNSSPTKRVWFQAHLVEEAKGLTFGFEPWMTAEVSGDTLTVSWPERKATSYWSRKTALPER